MMIRSRSISLTLVTVLAFASGCIFFPNFNTDQPPASNSVADVSPGTDSSQPGREVDGVVRVDLVNATEAPATCMVTMTLADEQVHFAERTLPAGGSAVIVGPDNAETVSVLCRVPEAEFETTTRFELGVDFQAGDTIRVTIRLPREPNLPTPKPPLAIRFGLDNDQTVEVGQPVQLAIGLDNSDEATRLAVFADPDRTPDSGNEIPIVADLPASQDNSVTWDTTGVPLGTYSIYVEASDDERFTRSAPSAGSIILVGPLQVAVLNLDENITVEVGQDVSLSVQTAGAAAPDAAFDVHATRLNDPNMLVIPVATGLPAAALTDITWQTTSPETESSVPAGTYAISATLTDGARQATSAATAGNVTILRPLSVFLTLFEDLQVERGASVTITGFTGGLIEGSTFDLLARRIDVEGNEPLLPIALDQTGNGAFGIDWDTTEVTPGTYRTLAFVHDPVNDRTATAASTGTIEIVPQLSLAILGLEEDVVVEYDANVPYTVQIDNTLSGQATFDVFAVLQESPGTEFPIETALPAASQTDLNFLLFSKASFVPGSYALRVDLHDGERSASVTSTGRVILLAPLRIEFTGLNSDITVAAGDPVPFGVRTFNTVDPNASFDVVARPTDGAPIEIASDLPAEPNTDLVFDTTGLEPGSYRLLATLTDGDRFPIDQLSFRKIIISSAPTLVFTDPNGPVGLLQGTDPLNFGWIANDLEEDATISFLLDPDLELNGNEITVLDGISEDAEPVGSASVPSDDIPEGDYYLLGLIDDGFTQVPVYAVDVCVTATLFGTFAPLEYPGQLTTIVGEHAVPNDPNSVENVEFGYALDISRDLDGDGADDIAIGDPLAEQPVDGLIPYGAAYFHRQPAGAWPASLDASQMLARIVGQRSDEQFGHSVAMLAPFGPNTPGPIGELLVGAPAYDGGKSSNDGRALTLRGSKLLSPEGDLFRQGELVRGSDENRLGTAVADAGDVNGDGFGDALIAAIGHSGQRGRVAVLSGANDLPSGNINFDFGQALQGSLWDGGDMFDEAGTALAGGAPFDPNANLDGIVIGAPGAASNAGRAYLIPGGDHLTDNGVHQLSEVGGDEPGVVVTGAMPGDRLGSSVALGDFNGDARPDFFLGAPGVDGGKGRVYVLFGSSDLPPQVDASLIGTVYPGVVLRGVYGGGQLGASVTCVPDQNGDGVVEVAMGAPGYNDDTGAVHLLYSDSSLPADLLLVPSCGQPLFTILGEDFGDRLGSAVSGGDLNGDGAGDLAAGAPGANKVYVFFGEGPPPVPCRGDLNGDGVVDLSDLSVLLGQFGAPGSADLNGDGTVNLSDLAILLNEFGRGCP